MLKFIVVFNVGFEPEAPGCVFISCTAVEFGGTKLLILNWTNAFLTGKIPGD